MKVVRSARGSGRAHWQSRWVWLFVLGFIEPLSVEAVPAFPGALGFGAGASGGAGLDANSKHVGGTVYHVTNLKDFGAGSFRDAVGSSGRIVIFDVGGYINLSSAVSVQGNITIAGQTAPGGGIGFSGAEISFANRSNIICRFIRVRPGSPSPSTDDCLSFYRASNIIVDHSSLEFAKWNNIDAVGDSTHLSSAITVQNSIIANPIGQQFGAHTECVNGTFSWFNNLFSNGHNRQPLAKDNTIFINNVLYNFSAGYTTHTSTPFKHDIINNCFIFGPATGTSPDNTWYQIDKNQTMYYSGNIKDSSRDGVLNGSPTTPYYYQGAGPILTAPWSALTLSILASNPPLTAANAVVYNNSAAGALPHDEMDSLIISQVKTLGKGTTGTGPGTTGPGGGLYTSEVQTGLSNGGFGTIPGGIAPLDSDRDGMPDDWEAAKGLNSNSAADGGLTAASGYTNLEDYLNWLALPHAFTAKNTAALPTSVDVDLRTYADGFPAGAPFSVSAPSGGALTQSGAGGYLVHFVPALNTSGLGGFSFSVSAGDYTMSSAVGILVSPNPLPKNLLWRGNSTTNLWDVTSLQWFDENTAAVTAFGTGDRVLFDDSGSSSPAINLSGALAPSYLEVNADTKNYTFGGSGSLSGAMLLVVDGAGSVTLNNGANTFTGGTLIQGTTLFLSGSATLGSGSIGLQQNAILSSNYGSGTSLNLGANTLSVDAGNAGTVNFSPKMVLGGGIGAGTINLNVRGTAPVPDGSSLGALNNYLTGNWSSFSGYLNVTGMVAGAQLDLNINGGSFTTFGSATLNLDNVTLQSRHNSGGNIIAIGALNGTASAKLGGSEYAGGTTYSIGALNTNSEFAGTISNGAAVTSLTKTGTGRLTLTGTNSYTGTTSVTGGTLGATGSFAGLVSVAGGTLSPGAASGTVGSVVANAGLTVAGGTLSYELSNSPSGANDKVTVSSGTLTLSGIDTFKLTFTNGVLGAGVYSLIDGSATMSVSSLTMALSSPMPATGTRQTVVLSRQGSGSTPAFVKLTVTGDAASLNWNGTNGGLWDLSTTQSWDSTAATNAHLFYHFDTVNFTDSTTQGAVALSGSLQPNVVNVSSDSTAYTFSGTGTLDGGARLTKSGSGTLTINGTGVSTYSGGTTIVAGTLSLATTSAAPLGSGKVFVTGGTLDLGNAYSLGNSAVFGGTSTIKVLSGNAGLVSTNTNTLSSSGVAFVNLAIPSLFTISGDMSAFSGTLAFGAFSGTLRLNGNANANFGSATTLFDLGTGTATLCNRNGDLTVNLGGLQGGIGTTLSGRQSGTGATVSEYVVGALNGDQVFSGQITTGGDTGGLLLTKVGTGNWTLAGTSNFTGDVSVTEGKLTVSGSLTHAGDFGVHTGSALRLSGGAINTGTLQIDSGAIFSGCGAVSGAVVNQGLMLVDCGGALSVTGDLENDGVLRVVNGSTIAVKNGVFINNGTLDIMGSPLSGLPASFVNNGTVLDSSLVKIESFSRNASAMNLSIIGYPGHLYQLQTKTLLADPLWLNVGTAQAGAGALLMLTDPAPGTSQRFYRIQVSP